jgi:isoquinoline 1-oxidoreductase subunit alpha
MQQILNGCAALIGLYSSVVRNTQEENGMELQINGKTQTVQDAATMDGTMPLLWVLRDVLNMTGTKFGCGVAACGACTVRVDGQAVRSCITPVSGVAGKQVQTIEGLGADKLHAVQQAWIAEQVPQCGYCQSGMLMAAASLLEKNPAPTDPQIDEAMTNICRCGTYQRVRAGIHRAAKALAAGSDSAKVPQGAPA